MNPLDEVSAWLQNPETPLFTVRAASPENWRLAILDRYDGRVWAPSQRMVPTGGRVPPPVSGPAVRRRVVQDITIGGLSGLWLPAADRPASVGGPAVYADAASGTLLARAPLHPGLRYRVVSQVPEYAQRRLGAAVADDRAAADLALPERDARGRPIPQRQSLGRLARQATAGSTFPFQQALRLADYLRTNEVYDAEATPGHAYRNLEFFLTTSHRGTSEQFAAAFAVMARTLGLPSRVVVGFRPGAGSGGTWQVRAGDVLVWPEVGFKDLGWVPFYPTPDRASGQAGAPAVPAGESAARRAADLKAAAARPAPPRRTTPAVPKATGPTRGRTIRGRPWAAVARAILVVAALAALSYLLLVTITPYWRSRRRRRAARPAVRVVGAWRETLHRLGAVGLAHATNLTAEEVARSGADLVGPPAAEHLLPLAALVNRACFGPAPTEEVAAREAWEHCDAVAQMIASSLGPARRLGRRLHPRVLRR
ncbi:DUF3488 and transglutaminase-like domain-containing protein [Actinoallomurus sp. NPDC052308]|uniref:DUF3488 and transglutaminase-like domain-containing protein n=1 Tax=Actinoallomurus sp. NPDC052308 TaxID=3155530 RepID=UPI003425F776